ncbi:hypothetical protein F5877DRAFT_79474 [Lentinula edodes]|nr:hypothetical protein F5877DRAFT_79474 [Lentinula edodes]
MIHTNKLGYFGKGQTGSSQPFEGIETVYNILEYAARTHGTRRALGWHEIVDIHEEEKEDRIGYQLHRAQGGRVRNREGSPGVSFKLALLWMCRLAANAQCLLLIQSFYQHSTTHRQSSSSFTMANHLKLLVSDVIAVRESIQVFLVDKTHQLVKPKSTEPLTARFTGPPKSVVSPMSTLSHLLALYIRSVVTTSPMTMPISLMFSSHALCRHDFWPSIVVGVPATGR